MSRIVNSFVLILLILSSGCRDKAEVGWFNAGESRASIYAKLGEPSNYDTSTVCVWIINDKSNKKISWRSAFRSQRFIVVAVFDTGDKSMEHKMTPAQLGFSANLSDSEVIDYMRR